jgi:hypothetical protein
MYIRLQRDKASGRLAGEGMRKRETVANMQRLRVGSGQWKSPDARTIEFHVLVGARRKEPRAVF